MSGGFWELKYLTCLVHSLWYCCVVGLHTVLSQPQRVETLHWVIPSGPVEHHVLKVVTPWTHTHTHTHTHTYTHTHTHTHTHKGLIINLQWIWTIKDNIISPFRYSLHWWWNDDGDDEMMVMVTSSYTRDGWLGFTGTHSSPAARCTPVCPWGTWSGPCYRRSSLWCCCVLRAEIIIKLSKPSKLWCMTQ